MSLLVVLVAMAGISHPAQRAIEIETQLAGASDPVRLQLLGEAAALPWPAASEGLEAAIVDALPGLDAAARRAWARDRALPVLAGELAVTDDVRRLMLEELRVEGHPKHASTVALARARLLYRRGQVAEAESVYREVPRLTDAWPEALRERAWSLFVLGRTADALGSSVSLSAPWFPGEDNAEARLLAGAALVGRCRWEEARAVVAPLADAPQLSLDPNEAARFVAAADVPPSWSPVVASPLVARVRRLLLDEASGPRREGLIVLATRLAQEAATDQMALEREVRRRALAVRYEALRGERRVREAGQEPKKAPAAELGQLDDDEVAWSFDGTWWIDELGTYRWSLGDACGRTP